MKKKIYKATAKSPANIAFIKFWGKRDSKINLPFNNSVSMNLSNCFTVTTVEFNSRFKQDRVFIDDKEVEAEKKARVGKILDIIRKKAGLDWRAKVVSKNNFPSDAGIASSASGFSALALAASKAAGLKSSLKELSILARLGSGSACRSVIDGFAEWRKGKNTTTSFAIQVAEERKKISSTEGHEAALTSPYFKARLKEPPKRIKNLWNKGTIEVINKLYEWRAEGLLAYFTIQEDRS